MKTMILMLLGATAGCVTPPQDQEVVPEHGSTVGFRCEAGNAQGLVGQTATSALASRALRLTGARTIRWIQPGQVVTMDYRTDRLNIELDGANRVSAIRCG